MSNSFAANELDAAGFPESTREVCYIEPIDDLAGDARELELEVTVQGIAGEARMAVGYVPGGPVTAGQQIIRGGERRTLKKQLVKPGAMLVVALDQPAHVTVRVAGARGWDTEEADESDIGDAWDVDEADDVELELDSVCRDVDPDQVVLGADDSAAAAAALAGAVTGSSPPLLGVTQTSPTTAADVMNAVLSELEQLLVSAQKNRTSSFLLLTGQSVDDALKNYRNMIAALRSARDRVVAGELPLKSGDVDRPGWLETADSIGKGIGQTSSFTTRWNLTNVVMKVAPELGKVGEGISDTLKAVAVILGLFLLVKHL